LTGKPAKSTAMIPLKNPFGFESINSFTELISNKKVFGLISANQTSAPTYRIQLAEAAKVIGVVITLSPS